MSTLSHIALIITYTLVAAAIFVVPDVFSSVDPARSSLLAVFVFLAGALVHEVMARRARQIALARRLASVRRELADIKAELARSREETKRLADAIERASGSAGASAAPAPGETPDAALAAGAQPSGAQPAGASPGAPAQAEAHAPETRAPDARVIDAALAEVRSLEVLIERANAEKPGAPAGPRQGLAAVLPADRPADAADADALETLEHAREALVRDRIDLYLQPIVTLPQRKLRFYECFPRLRAADGATILPAHYAEIAEKTGQSTALDDLLLFRTLQLARKARRDRPDAGFVCAVARATLDDAAFLNEIASLVRVHPELAAQLVLEFPQGAFALHNAVTGEALAGLGALGVRFSIDHVDNLRLDGKALAREGVKYVKIPAKALLSELRLDRPSIDPRALKDGLDVAGIDLVVEDVESESDLMELIDFQIDFGQGFLFGEQRLAKDVR
jgi:cyclic-di-GMP phosphodiesterase TipF (flagellum assembly factor)